VRILFVENHARFARVVIAEFLSGHEVTVAPTLFLARSAIQSERSDVILLDYDLDDGKGKELVQDILALQPTPKIIGVSAHEQGNAAMLETGVHATCNKMRFNQISNLLQN
jgi:DNA-binding response OmpR family regulator